MSSASADATDTIANPFFKAQTPGAGLNSWQTSGTLSSAYLSQQGISCRTGANVNLTCLPEPGTPIALAGTAGSVAAPQASLLGAAGVPQRTFRYRSTDIYSPTAESDIYGDSNFAVAIGGCNADGSAGTTTLSQSFNARGSDVLYGWSFFSSADWWPDSGAVKVIAPDGTAATVFQSEIVGNPGDPVPPSVGPDHPVGATPHGDLGAIPGIGGTNWVKWTYTFPQAGTYTLQASSTNGNDCNGPSALGLQLKPPHPIKSGQTIDFNPPHKTYGDPDFNLSAVALDAHDSTNVNPAGQPTYRTTDSDCTVTPAGTVHIVSVGDGKCDVTVSAPENRSYAPISVTKPVIIDPALLRVDANDQSKPYGDPNRTPAPRPLTGFVNGEDASAASANVTGDPSCTIDSSAGPDAGTYDNAITCTPGSLSARNYAFQTGVQGTLTITKAPLQINPDNQTKQYGDPDPTPLTYSLSGFVNGQNASSAQVGGDPNCSIDATAGPNVGSYPGKVSCGPGTLRATNYSFMPGNATLTITPANQTITVPSGHRTYGDPDFSVSVTASSDLPVSLSSTTLDVCRIVNGRVHIVGAGSCGIVATQDGNGSYAAASGSGVIEIAKAPLQITPANQTKQYGAPDPAPLTSSLSGFVNGETETETSANVTGNAACSIGAAAGPNVGTYAGAISCGQGSLSAPNYSFVPGNATLTITKANQTITFPTLSKSYGDPDFDPATASSGLPVSYTSSTTRVCTIVAGKVHIVALGTCSVTASQTGNGNYNPAANVTQSFTIGKTNQTINFPQPPDKSYGDPNFDPGATASSGLAVTYTSSTTQVCKISSGKVQILGAGTCTITASQSGNTNYAAAQSVTRSFKVSGADQTINFPQPPDKVVGDADFAPGATASSGLAVTYASSTPAVCTIVSGRIHIVAAGQCTIGASQAGNSYYNPAPNVSRTFTVSPKTVSLCTNKCESLLMSPTPAAGATLTAGQTMTIGYADDSPIGTGSLAPTAQLSDGRLLPVTISPTTVPLNYVTNYKRDNTFKNQVLLSFSLPATLSPGAYSVLVTVHDGDGDQDIWSWPINVQ